MWLPKSLYETIPWLFLIIGVAALSAAFVVAGWYWAEICAGAGLIAIVYGLVLMLRRKGYRASRSRLDFDA
jgi:Flp pilus assembly protein TadB